MTELAVADEMYLDGLKEKNLSRETIVQLIQIWQDNHKTTTTLFNTKRWLSRKHMNPTITALDDILKDIPEDHEGDLDDDIGRRVFNEVVLFHDNSKTSSAKTHDSTTSQIVTALCTTATIKKYIFDIQKNTQLLDEHEIILKASMQDPITYDKLNLLVQVFADYPMQLNKQYLAEKFSRLSRKNADYEELLNQIFESDPIGDDQLTAAHLQQLEAFIQQQAEGSDRFKAIQEILFPGERPAPKI